MIDPAGATGTAEIEILRLFLDGRPVEPRQGKFFDKMNPCSREVDTLIAAGNLADVGMAVKGARTALRDHWRGIGHAERSRCLRRVAERIREHQENLALLAVKDLGKPIADARSEASAAACYWDFFAGLADKIYGTVNPAGAAGLNFTLREPVGVVAAILPCSLPIWTFAMKVAPALACGNAVIVKPSELSPRGPLRLAELCIQAGVPAGVINVVTGEGESAGVALVRHDGVDHVSFTGNSETGKQVAEAAGSHLATVTCQLSGKSPTIVFGDADLDHAVEHAIAILCRRRGPDGLIGSRVLIQEEVKGEFVERLLPRVNAIRVGLPLAEESQLSCLPSEEHFERVSCLVRMGVEEGAQLLAGGKPPTDPDLERGYYYRPTVLDNVKSNMTVAQEEIGGPVLQLITFESEEHAIRIANATRFGSAAWIFTRDIGRIHRLAAALEIGAIRVNNTGAIHPSAPYGGFKESGIGTESGMEVIHSLTRLKNVSIGIPE